MLQKALRSVLNQTFRELEVLVVDDASEDETRRTMGASTDPRVRYIRQDAPHGGAAARNVGIENARGRFVAFLDDDDEWFPHKLDRQMPLFRSSPIEPGVVYSSYLVVDRQSERVLGRKIAEKRGDLSRDILERNALGGTSCVVARRAALEAAGLFDESLPSFHDYDLWIRLAPLVRFDCVEEPLSKYYVHQDRIWHNYEKLDRGLDRMFEKHGRSAGLRRNLGRQSVFVGVQYCREGQPAAGRRSIRRGLRWNPSFLPGYVHLGLSLLSGERHRRLLDARAKNRIARGEVS
jgi:glycosyltransferase involved in cell wall biosynthesis